MKYIEITFGDNDFGLPVENALRRLWKYISKNNTGPKDRKDTTFSGMTTIQIFYALHKAGSLLSLFERLYCLEYLACSVEYITRGLYWTNVKWEEKMISNASEINFKNDYLSFDIKFRRSGKFKEKWQNGEHAYLNLETGEVASF